MSSNVDTSYSPYTLGEAPLIFATSISFDATTPNTSASSTHPSVYPAYAAATPIPLPIKVEGIGNKYVTPQPYVPAISGQVPSLLRNTLVTNKLIVRVL